MGNVFIEPGSLSDDWGLWFCCYVSCRNQSNDLHCGSFVWVLFGSWFLTKKISNSLWLFYCNFNHSLMPLLDRIFIVGIVFILKLANPLLIKGLLNYSFSRMPVIEGQSEFSAIANLSIDCSIKKCLKFLYWILLFTLQCRGVTFYVMVHLYSFKT